jgi:hypothetical protein
MFYFYVLQSIRDKDLYLDSLPKFLSVGVKVLLLKFQCLWLEILDKANQNKNPARYISNGAIPVAGGANNV